MLLHTTPAPPSPLLLHLHIYKHSNTGHHNDNDRTVHITLTISLFVTASVSQKHFLSLLPKLEVEKILNYKVVFLLHLSSRSTSSLVCVRTLFLEL